MDNFYAKAVCKVAVHTYGKDLQRMTAIEEMAELTQALSKDKRYPNTPEVLDNIAEEIADVRIMLDQLEYIYDCSNKVEEYRKKKIYRLVDRINKVAQ